MIDGLGWGSGRRDRGINIVRMVYFENEVDIT